MVFVLDNYDSFTYNLVQYLGELGARAVVKRNDEVTVDGRRRPAAGTNRAVTRAWTARGCGHHDGPDSGHG